MSFLNHGFALWPLGTLKTRPPRKSFLSVRPLLSLSWLQSWTRRHWILIQKLCTRAKWQNNLLLEIKWVFLCYFDKILHINGPTLPDAWFNLRLSGICAWRDFIRHLLILYMTESIERLCWNVPHLHSLRLWPKTGRRPREICIRGSYFSCFRHSAVSGYPRSWQKLFIYLDLCMWVVHNVFLYFWGSIISRQSQS